MSQAPQSHESQGPISTPQQLVAAVAAAFVVPVVIIALLVSYVSSTSGKAAGSDALSAQATTERIMPVGTVEIKMVSANAGPRSGEEVYKAVCGNCHATGMMGSPKFGDNGAWAARLGQGIDKLVEHAIKGFNAMPAQGGGDVSDLEVHRAVAFMGNAAGGKFDEPAAPAAAASDAASAP
jgi:cytochrome c5